MSIYDELPVDDIYSDNMPEIIRVYLRDDELPNEELKRYWQRAVKYIEDYTGHSREELAGNIVLVQPLLAMVADMHDNRQWQLGERSYINELCERYIGLYSHNLI